MVKLLFIKHILKIKTFKFWATQVNYKSGCISFVICNVFSVEKFKNQVQKNF